MSMQVIEAQLTLLLRLSSARRSSRAEVTDDVSVIGKLVHCKVRRLSLRQCPNVHNGCHLQTCSQQGTLLVCEAICTCAKCNAKMP